jgi:hypothetical protein
MEGNVLENVAEVLELFWDLFTSHRLFCFSCTLPGVINLHS